MDTIERHELMADVTEIIESQLDGFREDVSKELELVVADVVSRARDLILDDVDEELDERFLKFVRGLEQRLADAMEKALDTVTHNYDERLRSLEEDQARILRHTGLDG